MLGVLSGILCYSPNTYAAFPVGTLFSVHGAALLKGAHHTISKNRFQGC